jgi:hypothetical protein
MNNMDDYENKRCDIAYCLNLIIVSPKQIIKDTNAFGFKFPNWWLKSHVLKDNNKWVKVPNAER